MIMIIISCLFIIINFIVLLILSLFFKLLPGLISGTLLLHYDIGSWNRMLFKDNYIFLIICTAILSSIFYLIYQGTLYFIKNNKKFIIGIGAGCSIILIIVLLYWKLIEENIPKTIFAFKECYNMDKYPCIYWFIYSILIYVIGIIINKWDLLIIDNFRKVIWKQIFSGEDLFCNLLFLGEPYCIFISAMGITMKIFKRKFSMYFTLMIFVICIFFLIKKSYQYITIREYYKNSVKDLNGNIILIQESPSVKKSFILENYFKTTIIKDMMDRKIYFYPIELKEEKDVYIKIDVYEKIDLNYDDSYKNNINIMSEKKGVYNYIYVDDKKMSISAIPLWYDKIFTDINDLKLEIINSVASINYKKEIEKKLENIKLNKINQYNCIIDEIVAFKNHIINLTDKDLIFDYLIKSFENVNYMFALTSISRRQVKISNDVIEKIQFATFGTWRNIIDEQIEYDSELKALMLDLVSDASVFQTFNDIWHFVTSNNYEFEKYSLQKLLKAVNELRNYTRGHGVFTLEISYEINQKLVEICVFLIDHVTKYIKSANNMDNLSKLRWIISLKNINYYLYSSDKSNNTLVYKAFQSSETLLIDIDNNEEISHEKKNFME